MIHRRAVAERIVEMLFGRLHVRGSACAVSSLTELSGAAAATRRG
jgi:hypothetical protein